MYRNVWYGVIMMTHTTYTRSGEWSDQSVRPAKTGWIVEMNSRVSGHWTNRRILVPYSDDFPAGADLASEWNPISTLGDAIIHVAADGGGRLLRKGWMVQ